MTNDELRDAIVANAPEIDGVTLYRGYSGRGMYGRRCLGLQIERGHSESYVIAKMTAMIARDDVELADEFADLCETAGSESLGLDQIVYFPGMDDEGGDGND